MSGSRTASRMVMAMAIAALAGSAMAPAPAPSATVEGDLAAAYVDLRGDIDAASDLKKSERRSLDNFARQSERHAASGDVCAAVDRLDHLVDQTQKMRARSGASQPFDGLAVRAWQVIGLLEDVLPAGSSCDEDCDDGDDGKKDQSKKKASGDADSCPVPEPRPTTSPVTTVTRSDTVRLEGSVALPKAKLTTVAGAGRLWTDVHVPGVVTELGLGQPLLPTVDLLVAVPAGAGVPAVQVFPHVGDRIRVDLAPGQPGGRDEETVPGVDGEVDREQHPPSADRFGEVAFEFDAGAYAVDRQVLPDVMVTPVGRARDLALVQVSVPMGNYNPTSDELLLYDSFSFNVEFGDSDGYFVTERALGPFEPALSSYASLAINGPTVSEYVGVFDHDLDLMPCRGGELLIMTHPDFRPAADRLAAHKRARGLTTIVQNVADGSGSGPDTAAQIDAFIEDAYDGCAVRPSYVLLMGDAEFIPPSMYTATNWSANTGSDYGYATDSGFGLFSFLPVFATGRIPVDTIAQAEVVVDKIIAYEASPPTKDSFYDNVSIASYFQCCQAAPVAAGTTGRGFIEVSERVRNQLLGEGYGVDRIYTTDTAFTGYTGDTTPRRYFDGTLLPEELRAANGFQWNGSTQDIIDDWDDGRFLMLHRDHGGRTGWVDPSFSRDDLEDLDNGALQPVIYSINCSSGYWDNETSGGDDGASATATYWAEQALRIEGGAVGIIGDTRDSSSWGNNVMTLGLFDATWPDTVPGFGGATSHRRLGDILNHAKMYVLTQMNVGTGVYGYGAGIASDQLVLYHVIGDPSLAMWTQEPVRLRLDHLTTPIANGVVVKYAEEAAQVTAWQLSRGSATPIGRGTVVGGEARVEYFLQPEPRSQLLLSASRPGAVGALLTEVEVPTEPAYPVLIDDPDAFVGDGVIDFDDAEVAEHVADRYANLGVRFLDDEVRTPLVVGPDNRRPASTSSEPNSLFNDNERGTSSSEVPLMVVFAEPVRRVGSYLGNGDGTTAGVLTAYDAAGGTIASYEVGGITDDVATFAGIDAGASVIHGYSIDYGATPLGEEIDDLMFE